MKTLLCLLMAAFCVIPAMADENVTGRWTGTFTMIGADGQTKDSGALLVLKQEGSQITGTAGPTEDEQYTIQNGKIEGNKLTLDVAHGDHPIHLELVVAEDRIQGDARGSGEEGEFRAKLDVKRAK